MRQSYLGSWLILLIASCCAAQPIELDSVGMAGTRVYRPGYWSQLGASFTNPSDTDASTLLTVSLDELNTARFAVRPWVPAEARRRINVPIYLAVEVPKDQRSWPAQAMLIDDAHSQERLLQRADLLILIYQDRVSTVAMVDAQADHARRVIRVLRDQNKLSPATASIAPPGAPDRALAWDGVDTALIAHSQADQIDPAQYDALRQWLLGGGRLWIMLDRTPHRFSEQLLGDTWDITPLDRIELTSVEIKRKTRSTRRVKKTTPSESLSFDYPVDMVRIIAPSTWNITHTVNGYPAALWQNIGRGKIYLTTLEARAWLTPEKQITESLKSLRSWLQVRDPPQTHDIFDHFVAQQIGYRVLAFAPVASVLGGYLLVILVTGLWLLKRHKLQRLAPIAAGLALIATAGLTILGLSQQSSRPTTLATAQLAMYDAQQPYVNLTRRLSIYRSPAHAANALQLAGQGGPGWPSLAAQGGQIMRWVSLPGQRWQMEQLSLPSGAVTRVLMTYTKPLTSTARAVIDFDEQGQIRGHIEGDAPAHLDDAVISSRDGRLAVHFQPDHTFTATTDDALDTQQFIRATAFTQTQQARLGVYRSLFENANFLPQTSLLGWTKNLPTGLTLGQDVTEQNDALLAIPLVYAPPRAHQQMTLPFALLKMSVLHSRDAPGVSSGTTFDIQARKFIANISTGGDIVMRFDLPAQLLPMKLDTATVDVNLTALGREVSLVVYRDGQLKTIETFTSPNPRITRTLTGENLPTLMPDGWVGVGLHIGPSESNASAGWTLRNIQLHLTATSEAGDNR